MSTISWRSMPILNKFACLVKKKWMLAEQKWKIKRRIIMDSKRSGVKGASTRKYKSMLPRITDAVSTLLGKLDDAKSLPLAASAVSGSEPGVEQFVIDATDAFWEVGLHPEERRFFVGKLGDNFLVYLRTAQGSRGAPITWAAIFGLVCRCVQSLFYTGHTHKRGWFEAELQVYVDDPWAALIGNRSTRDRLVTLMIVAWRVLGVTLAFPKARRGLQVDWIGANLLVADGNTVRATIMADRVSEVKHLTDTICSGNLVTVKDLRSYTGKLQSMASLLHTWRPFVGMLWAALYQPRDLTSAPPGLVWSSQLREPTNWFKAFWNGDHNQNLVRDFDVEHHFNRGQLVVIYVDASPYGLGGWISVSGCPCQYFADGISESDCLNVGVTSNEGSSGQQAFEALALLVAVRLWLPHFKTQRVKICLRGDNMAALYAVAKMQPKSKALGIVARELALDLADASYAVDFVQHVAGLANGSADSLSRKWQPGKEFVLPSLLASATEVQAPTRCPSWWRNWMHDHTLNGRIVTDAGANV